MGSASYGDFLQHAQEWQDIQRKQAIAQNQDATLNISSILRKGTHPDTGAALTPAEIVELTRQHKELTAHSADLWNQRQDPNKMGKAESAASGVAMPESMARRLTDRLHLTKPNAPGVRQTTTTTTPDMKIGDRTLPGGQSVTVQGPPKTPQQQMSDLQGITEKYRTQPGQAEAEAAQTQLQSKLQAIDADPKLTPEQKADARRRAYGVGEHPALKLYTLPDGTRTWLDASRPDLIPDGATAAVTETADTRSRSDFAAFQKANPDYKGTFEQWKSEQGAKGRATAKPETLDKRYQDVLVKEASNRPLSPDEKSLKAAWQIWNRETKIDPGVARAAAFGASRYIAVVDNSDPNNPGNVVMMRAGDAAKAHAGTPASIAFQTEKAITKAFTSGKPAETINYFNTARDHLGILRDAVTALNNGDTQLFNSWAQKFATATGSPAPTNFDTIRNAVAGELAKTFKGTGATDEEIALISSTINNAQSPDQLFGAIDSDIRLMDGKMNALKLQFDQGKKGKPNFPSDVDDIVKALNKK